MSPKNPFIVCTTAIDYLTSSKINAVNIGGLILFKSSSKCFDFPPLCSTDFVFKYKF